jgi:hypothetical protein
VRADPPQEVMGELFGGRRLERGVLDTLRIHRTDYVPDDAPLPEVSMP